MAKKRRTETRSSDPSWSALAATSGVTSAIDARVAENLSTLFACVTAISTACASLPAYVYRVHDKGRDERPNHAVARLVRRGPNRHQSWVDWVEWMLASVLLRGNALSEVILDERGEVEALRPVPWEHVSVQLLPTGRLAYDVVAVTYLSGGTGRDRRLLEGEVIHLRDRSDDGLVGRSRLSRAGATVAAGLSVQDFSTAMYRNGINPSGAFKVDQKLSAEQRQHLREGFNQLFSGSRNAAKALILEGGTSWQQISVSPEDAELLASRRFSTEELARLFQVPPPLVGIWDHSSFTNSETAGRWFAQFTLTPWIRKLESEFSRAVFGLDADDHELVLDLSGFMRGDYAARWQAHKIAIETQVLDVDEVREIEGWNPKKKPEDEPEAQDVAASQNAA